MVKLNRRVLVLNASYEPIHICTARRAVVLVLKGTARMEESTERQWRAGCAAVPVPSVIRLVEYRRIVRRHRGISRRQILLRDEHTCQYCAVRLGVAALTLDHVLPRSRGGENTWENLVACCLPCNTRKGDRTPEEARMKLLRKPRSYGAAPLMRQLALGDAQWEKYVFV